MARHKTSVVGAGAWGTALAQSLASHGHEVVLWAREPDVVDDINQRQVNRAFLPGIELERTITATTELAVCAASDVILMVVPAQFVRPVLASLAGNLSERTTIVMCSKGIEQSTGKLMTELVEAALPATQLAVLSGPSFASDVARGLPTALTLACRSEPLGAALAEKLSSRQMRLYWSKDVLGAELGGAIKNVLAIAAGIVVGRGLGASAHAAVVTRGFAELRRFGEAMGAQPETLLGLSGLGDLVLTCGSPQSRNMSLGSALGRGERLQDILGARAAVTEGVATAAALTRLAEQLDVDMPIATAVQNIIDGTRTVDETVAALMQRPLKAED